MHRHCSLFHNHDEEKKVCLYKKESDTVCLNVDVLRRRQQGST